MCLGSRLRIGRPSAAIVCGCGVDEREPWVLAFRQEESRERFVTSLEEIPASYAGPSHELEESQ